MPSLWVAAAINVDNNAEDPFLESDNEEGESAYGDHGYDEDGTEDEDYGEVRNANAAASPSLSRARTRSTSPPSGRRQSLSPHTARARHGSPAAGGQQHSRSFGAIAGGSRRPSGSLAPFSFTRIVSPPAPQRRTSGDHHPSTPEGQTRRLSSSHVLLPAIYANTGVSTPPALLEALGAKPSTPTPTNQANDPFLAPIVEGQVTQQPAAEPVDVNEEGMDEKPLDVSFKWSLLPLFIIFQYFVLALHSTSHDQVFLMYLTS